MFGWCLDGWFLYWLGVFGWLDTLLLGGLLLVDCMVGIVGFAG